MSILINKNIFYGDLNSFNMRIEIANFNESIEINQKQFSYIHDFWEYFILIRVYSFWIEST
jgi:hypothetical protein